MAKRIVFVNLHGNEMLLKTMPKYIFKQSVAIKHGYLLQYLLNNPQYEVCSFINQRGFSLAHNGNKVFLDFLNLFRYSEHRTVLRKNGLNVKKITVIRKISDIRRDDIVILYRLYHDQFLGMEAVKAFKAVSMIHFGGDRKEAEFLRKLQPQILFNESNLDTNSEIYRRFYDGINAEWLIHPFVFAKRFENKKPFKDRKNMAVAVGTITYKTNSEFLEVYTDPCDQPSRKQIKDNPEYFNGLIDCLSSDYLEGFKATRAKTQNGIMRFVKKIYNRFHTGQQKQYYSFNMVDKFNEYKMCIVGEEILGVPGIGFVEGMACGCAYIGLDSPMYKDVGLVPGKHYITYDGSIRDLKRVISYYQEEEHKEELERIAREGTAFVREHFSGEEVARNIIQCLEDTQKQWAANR